MLTAQHVFDQGLTGWTHLGNGLYTRVTTADYATGRALVDAIGAAAEAADRYPDVRLRRVRGDVTVVDVALADPDAAGVSDDDVALAREVTDIAADLGLALDGRAVYRINLALDTPDYQEVKPFWRAFFAFEDRPGTDVVVRDPSGVLPSVWFQAAGSDEPRQRWHIDAWIDPAEVESRIEACLAAGGRVVDSTHAPAYWVLADPDGNRSCLATWQGRD